jgi:hypothetical protein
VVTAYRRGWPWAGPGDPLLARVLGLLEGRKVAGLRGLDLSWLRESVEAFAGGSCVFIDACRKEGDDRTIQVVGAVDGLGDAPSDDLDVGVGLDPRLFLAALAALPDGLVTVRWYRLRCPIVVLCGDAAVAVAPLMLCPYRMTAGEGLRATAGCACRDCDSLRRWGHP